MSTETLERPTTKTHPRDDFEAWASTFSDVFSIREQACEQEHVHSVCTTKVVWSRPADLCGCHGRMNVCDGAHKYLTDLHPLKNVVCGKCGYNAPVGRWLEGWYPV